MNAEDFLLYETNRRDSYKLVSACYYLPEENTLEKLAELETALGHACPEAVENIAKMRIWTDLAQLRVDYSKLFAGPFKLLAPPYGSVYLEDKREVMGDSTIDARNRYKEAGLDISGRVMEAPDHIGIELEFMYYLIFKEIEAIDQRDLESAINYLEKQKAFLERHLGRWVTRFTDNVEQNATTSFYQQLAQATNTFVHQDLKYSSEILQTQPWQTSMKQVI